MIYDKHIRQLIPLVILLSVFALGTFNVSAATSNNAQFVSQSVPSSMVRGQTYQVSVTMKNIGTTTWLASKNYRLGAQNPQDNAIWGFNRAYMASSDSIAPNQTKIFAFTVTAPSISGTYNFQWKMLQENVQWFGGFSTNVAVKVADPSVPTFYNADLSSVHHPFKGVGWNVNAGLPFSLYQTLLDDTAPQFLRVLGWDQSSYQPTETSSAYESAAIQPVYDLLSRAKQKNISVMLTNWNTGGKYDNYSLWPDHFFWLSQMCNADAANSQNRWCRVLYSQDPGTCTAAQKTSQTNVQGPETDHPYSDTVFAQTLVNSLDYIINQKGFKIDFVGIWNEPGGDWAYHPRDTSKKYPASFTGLYQNMAQKLSEKGLTSKTKLVGIDDAYAASWPSTSIVNYAMSNWANYSQAYSLHNYDGTTGTSGDVKYLFDRANGKPVIIGELGHKGIDGCEDSNGMDRWGNSIESTRLIISDARYGAYALARWWFNGGDPSTDCWVASSGNNVPVLATYNSLKILANSLPQTSQDISVVKTDFGDFDKNFDAVVINAASVGQAVRPVVWAVNKGSSDKALPINFTGLSGSVIFNTKTVKGSDSTYSIQDGSNYPVVQNQATFVIPANSIFVATVGGTTQVCAPNAVSGCKICNAGGTAWVDTNSKCGINQTCQNGICSTICTDDCTPSGTKQCSGTTGYQTCGNYDADTCLEWSSLTACAAGQTCSGGICGSSAAGYRIPIAVGNTGSALSDYQVKITVPYNSHMKSNFDDIRFTASDGANLSYWRESYTASAAIFWVKVNSIPAGSSTIYLKYGNASASTASNGADTFVLYDDFNSGDVSNWTLSSSCATGARAANSSVYHSSPYSLRNYFTGKCGAGYSYSSRSFAAPVNGTYAVDFYAKSMGCSGCTVSARLFFDNSQLFSQSISGALQAGTVASSLAPGTHTVKVGMYTTKAYSGTFQAYFDDIHVRKTASPAPTYSLGSEQLAMDDGTGLSQVAGASAIPYDELQAKILRIQQSILLLVEQLRVMLSARP